MGRCAGGRMEVVSPWDGRVLADVPAASAGDAETALASAERLHRERAAALPLHRRIEVLSRLASLMEARAEALAATAVSEGGKPLVDTRVEVARAIDSVRCAISALREEAGEVVPMGLTAATANRVAFTRRFPIGPVVAVSAFNHPLNLIVHQAVPALAAGCPVIVKPSEDTPLSCLAFVDLLREAGLPDGWCRAIVTGDRAVSQALATDPRVAYLSFIGSAAVGWMLRSKLAPGTRCALEHGGVAPVLVEDDADLDAAVPALTRGGFYHAGQVCVSVQRIYAARAIASALCERLVAAAQALRTGDPADPATAVGPLIRPREVARVGEWIDEARAAGGRVLCGGAPVDRTAGSTVGPSLDPTAYAPTVVLDPPDDVRLSRLEVFGPVVAVYTVDSMDDAVARANALPYAFQAAVFTRDLDRALRAWQRLDASAVMVNDSTAFRADWMPFGGLRESGLGVGGIAHAIRDCSVERMLVVKSPEV